MACQGIGVRAAMAPLLVLLVLAHAAGAKVDGDAEAARGRWVRWDLVYRGDSSGSAAETELSRDGESVWSASGSPNAYPGDDQAYLKLGLYKWDWQKKPSDVDERTLFVSDVAV